MRSKIFVALLSAQAFATCLADIELLSPASGEVVPVLTGPQRAFLSLSPTEKRAKFADKDYRRKEMGLPSEVVDGVSRKAWWPKTTRLEWKAKEGVSSYSVKVVGRNGDLAFDQCVTGTTAVVDNLMVATDYGWTVSANGESGSSTFRTEDVPLRLCRFPAVGNARDLGGARGLGGRRVKQGMIYRSMRFNEKTRMEGKRPVAAGEPLGTSEDRAYIVRRFGLRTDLDIRAGVELYGLEESPLGNGVRLVKQPFSAYKGAVGDYGKLCFRKIFRLLQDESAYPVDFHCSAGQDRTGSLAYLLEALLGVDDEQLADEWAYTGFFNRSHGFCHAKFYDALPRELKKRYPAPTTRESAEAFARAAGVSDEEIAKFRHLLLEPAVEPFRPDERVLFYGDSITHGGKYVFYLQLFESLRHPGSGVRLLNGGRSGGTARDGLVNFDREMRNSRPDRAFVMFGMNDLGRSQWKEETPSEANKAARGKSLERYKEKMAELADRFADAGVTLVLVTPTPFDQYNAQGGENIPFYNEPALSLAAETVRRLAKDRGLEAVDFHAPMTRLFRDRADDFVFCRDRVHPGNEGHLYMAALVLDAMGVSPVVETTVAKADVDAESACFDYAPKALPFPRMPEYEALEAFYPLTERLNREIVAVSGLKAGRYALVFEGRAVGSYSDEELAKGVNVALLDTPNQRRAQSLVPVMRRLQSVVAAHRNVILVRRMIEDAKGDPNDFAAADVWLEKWLEGQKKQPWYKGVKAWVDGYQAGRQHETATLAEIESLYAQMAAARPASVRVTVRRAVETP